MDGAGEACKSPMARVYSFLGCLFSFVLLLLHYRHRYFPLLIKNPFTIDSASANASVRDINDSEAYVMTPVKILTARRNATCHEAM